MTKTINDKSTIIENEDISNGLIKDVHVHTNLTQDVLVTTEDKVRICLMNSLSKMEKRSAWIAPAGILLTIVLTLLTTKFKDFYLSADTWTAIFVLSAAICFLWLLYCLKDAFASVEIDDVIEELKKGSPVKKNKGSIIYLDTSSDTPIEVKSADELQQENLGLKIIKATYGVPDKNVDVTDKINSLIKNDKLVTQASNALVDQDPANGIVKALSIEYEYQGKKYNKDFKENEDVSLP